MKNLMLSLVFISVANYVIGQNEYKIEMKNSPDSKIDIQFGAKKIKIVGHDKNEIIITTDFKGEFPETTPTKENGDLPDRAVGLKPLVPSPKGNSGIGLIIDKQGDHIIVRKTPQNNITISYTFYIPNKVSLNIMPMHQPGNTDFEIENLSGEVNIHGLNSDIKMKDVSGPIVANTSNGSVEIVYNNVTPDKPNSILSVNGFVDISLPKDISANLEIHAINGEVYTDWEIKADKDVENNMMLVPNMNMFNLEGTINGGGTPISIQSVNGDIFLRKKK